MTKSKCIFISIILFSIQSVYAGGGWPQPKGKGYFKLSEWWIIADQHFTDIGAIDPNTTTGLFNTNLYAEYGVTDRFTVIFNGALFSRTYMNNTISGTTGETIIAGESLNGLGDIDISAKLGLFKNSAFTTAATLTLGIPTGNSQGGTQGNLQTGDGEFNQMIQLDLGTAFSGAYANAYIAINNRTNGFSDEFRFGTEIGKSFFGNKLSATMRVFGVLSLDNGDSIDPANSTSVFANNTEHISIQPELNYAIGTDWGVSASVGGAVYGRLIFAVPSYSFGFYKTI